MNVYVWKQARGGKTYSLQIDSNKGGIRAFNRAVKVAEEGGWTHIGGTGPTTGSAMTLLFTKSFDDEELLKGWAKSLPYKVLYEGTNGKQRFIG